MIWHQVGSTIEQYVAKVLSVSSHGFMSDKEIHSDDPSTMYAVRDTCPHLHELKEFVEANKSEEKKDESEMQEKGNTA